jgi:hypothetical protein
VLRSLCGNCEVVKVPSAFENPVFISIDPLTHNRDGVTHVNLEEFLTDPPADLA